MRGCEVLPLPIFTFVHSILFIHTKFCYSRSHLKINKMYIDVSQYVSSFHHFENFVS